jgi:predicted nucleic acid-binding protein
MNRPLLIDTDVLIDCLRGRDEAVALVRLEADRIVLSAVVVAELYAGVKGDLELAALDDLVSFFRIVPVTADVAKAAGLWKRDYGRSHGVGLADAILAATARAENADLCTLNIKHYPMLKGLKPPYTKR